MGRRPCCSKDAGLNRGAWTPMEDKILTEFIKTHGEGQWRSLPERAGLKRCGKSCRLRWMNYLRPDIKRGSITTEEDDLIIRLHKLLGNRWSLIAGRLPGRTDNEIKNYWHTKLGKKINHQSGQNRESLKNRNLTKKQKLCAPKPRQNNDVKTSVIRTKAIRCTKPVILIPSPAESEGEKVHDQFDQSSSTSSPATSAEIDPLADSLMKVEGNDELDFVIDFEMDQHLLSDFLNTDWSDQSYYGGDQSRSDGNIYTSSPSTSDETLLFPSEETPSLRSDFESVDFPIEIGQWESWLQA